MTIDEEDPEETIPGDINVGNITDAPGGEMEVEDGDADTGNVGTASPTVMATTNSTSGARQNGSWSRNIIGLVVGVSLYVVQVSVL